jgi:hypothetical protein
MPAELTVVDVDGSRIETKCLKLWENCYRLKPTFKAFHYMFRPDKHLVTIADELEQRLSSKMVRHRYPVVDYGGPAECLDRLVVVDYGELPPEKLHHIHAEKLVAMGLQALKIMGALRKEGLGLGKLSHLTSIEDRVDELRVSVRHEGFRVGTEWSYLDDLKLLSGWLVSRIEIDTPREIAALFERFDKNSNHWNIDQWIAEFFRTNKFTDPIRTNTLKHVVEFKGPLDAARAMNLYEVAWRYAPVPRNELWKRCLTDYEVKFDGEAFTFPDCLDREDCTSSDGRMFATRIEGWGPARVRSINRRLGILGVETRYERPDDETTCTQMYLFHKNYIMMRDYTAGQDVHNDQVIRNVRFVAIGAIFALMRLHSLGAVLGYDIGRLMTVDEQHNVRVEVDEGFRMYVIPDLGIYSTAKCLIRMEEALLLSLSELERKCPCPRDDMYRLSETLFRLLGSELPVTNATPVPELIAMKKKWNLPTEFPSVFNEFHEAMTTIDRHDTPDYQYWMKRFS